MTIEPDPVPRDRRVAVLVAAIAIVALGVRLYHLDRRTITHPELFAPGIQLPAYTVEPTPRHTVQDVVRFTLNGDIHPPAYYLGELAWTRLVGTTLFALRLPSALAGATTVVLLFLYGRREAGTSAALLAAALLALHGQHVYWSQQARMWVPLSCLALASALLLSRVIEQPRRGRVVAYAIVAAIGVWTEYYFWPFFLALTLCATAAALADRRRLVVLDAQVLAMVLASPMLVYLHYQMQRGNFIASEIGEPLLSTLPFATIAPARALTVVLTTIAIVAVGAGIAARLADRIDFRDVSDADAPPVWFLFAGSLLASTVTVLALGAVSSRLTLVLVASIPWIASLIWWGVRPLIERRAPVISSPLARVARAIVSHPAATLTIATVALLFAIHLLREPVLVTRGLVMLSPFIALLMARGVFALSNRPARVVVGAALLTLSAVSTAKSYTRLFSPRDYQGLAAQLAPRMRAGDVVVVENGWWTSPIHYYLPSDRFHVVLPSALTTPLPPRVWIVTFRRDTVGEVETADRLAAARLPHYIKVEEANALLGHAALFEPATLR